MDNLSISIFGNKIFLEIINEIKLFSKFNIKYYEDLDLCIKDAENQNILVIFFINKKNKSFFNKNKINNFPSIFIFESSISEDIPENTTLPGTPITVEYSGTSCKTTDPEPILVLQTILIGPKTFAPAPITTSSETVGWRLPFLVAKPPKVTPW